MSWKSLVTASLLCALASPAFAVGPTLRVTNGPTLQAGTGNWIWNVTIQPSFDQSPIAAELGFDANRNVVIPGGGLEAMKGASFTGANTANPGTVIFGWETLTNLGGTGACDSGNPGNCPVGLQVGTGGNADKVFAALGSIGDLASASQATYLTIITEGPSNTNLTGSLQVLGAYGTGGNEGRIAELTAYDPGPPATADSANYKNYTGTASRTLRVGDINLNGLTNDSDFAIFGGNYSATPNPIAGGWTVGDFNRDGQVNDSDFAIFGGEYSATNTTPGGSISNLTATGILDPPAGSGGGGAVPEPTSMALVSLALLGGLGLARRKR